MNKMLNKVTKHFSLNQPFALYMKPNSKKCIGLFQQNNELYLIEDFNEIGFIFAPFDGNQIILIPEKQSEVIIESYKAQSAIRIEFEPNEKESIANKLNYEDLIRKGIHTIHKNGFKKIVLSRRETLDLKNFELTALIQNLFNVHSDDFSYCFFHPEVGLWMGAFSEQLIKMQGKTFETMAVAGTQKNNFQKATNWNLKERKEQQYVSDFIIDNLKNKSQSITVSEPFTLDAGNVLHIKTSISGILKNDFGIHSLLSILHPTPAVCGMPTQAAKEFILNEENYEREYYSGFFGELNKDFSTDVKITDLYVNLRCMQIKHFKTVKPLAYLYMGCGITIDSEPKKEWDETINKSLTMKRILNIAQL